MSAERPTEIGTIVQRPDGKRFAVLLQPGDPYAWRVCEAPDTYLCWASWQDIEDWNLVHRGWTPPTPEPMHHGARVIDAYGWRCVRSVEGDRTAKPWRTQVGGWVCWSDLVQPVTIISDGSDW